MRMPGGRARKGRRETQMAGQSAPRKGRGKAGVRGWGAGGREGGPEAPMAARESGMRARADSRAT